MIGVIDAGGAGDGPTGRAPIAATGVRFRDHDRDAGAGCDRDCRSAIQRDGGDSQGRLRAGG